MFCHFVKCFVNFIVSMFCCPLMSCKGTLGCWITIYLQLQHLELCCTKLVDRHRLAKYFEHNCNVSSQMHSESTFRFAASVVRPGTLCNTVALSFLFSPSCSFSAGALVWTKLEGHPWWPCMVVPQPLSGQQMRGKGRDQRLHVHFFDEPPTRGWVSTKYVREYKGKYALWVGVQQHYWRTFLWPIITSLVDQTLSLRFTYFKE